MITNKDFVTMKGNVAEIVGDTSAAFQTKIGKWINRRYRDFMRRYQWKELYDTYTITTVANQATYALPEDFGEAVYFYDNTNKATLWESPEFGSQNDTSLVSASQYFSISESSVKAQPTSASTLSVVSTSASDNTQTLFVKGFTGTVTVEETISLNGTTPVSSANSYTKVYQISKSAVSAGTISVTSDSAAVTQAVMSPKVMQARYRIAHLFYIPVGTTSIVVRYKRAVTPLINDYDYPIMDIGDELELGAEADAWRAKRQFSKSSALDGVFENELAKRMFQEEQNADITFKPTAYNRQSIIGIGNTWNT
jgi:hypothetical protein